MLRLSLPGQSSLGFETRIQTFFNLPVGELGVSERKLRILGGGSDDMCVDCSAVGLAYLVVEPAQQNDNEHMGIGKCGLFGRRIYICALAQLASA